MRTLPIAILLLACVAQSAPTRQIAHRHYLVANPAPQEYRGVVWLPAPGGAFLLTTTHSPDLERDRAQKRAFELPSQHAGGRIAVALTLKPGESKVVTVHTGPADRIARLRAAYPIVCDARLLGRGEEAVWESDRAAYSLRNGTIEAWGKLSSRGVLGQERIPLAAFHLHNGAGTPEIAAAGPAAAVIRSGAVKLTLGRNSRWTEVELPHSGTLAVSLPARLGEQHLQGEGWIATLAGSPAAGLALRADPALVAEIRECRLLLRPNRDGRIRYAFAAFWEREWSENVLEQGEGDEPLPRVPGMDRPNTSGRILLRPPPMRTAADFEALLRRDLVHFAAPPQVTPLAPEPAPAAPPAKSYDQALDLLLRRLRMLHEQGQGQFWFSSDPAGAPYYVKPNTSWGDGYLVSLLWDGFAVTRDEWFRQAALDANRLMLGGEDRQMHATGLNYWDASARSFRETGDARWRESGLRCAAMMARIADPSTGLIPEYGPALRRRPSDPYDQMNYVKVDALVGLPILWWAFEQTGETRYREVARRHTDATLAGLVEPDGAVLQMLWHEPGSGRILGVATHQGYGGNTRWARGLAWLLDGLPDAWRATKDEKYRAQFERSARWLEENLPDDLIAWYDFDDQGVFWRYRDSSTSAICAYGLLRMSELEPDPDLARRYRDLGRRLVEALIDRCLTPAVPGMLAQATYTKPAEGEFIWGNFSLVRALCWLKSKGLSR